MTVTFDYRQVVPKSLETVPSDPQINHNRRDSSRKEEKNVWLQRCLVDFSHLHVRISWTAFTDYEIIKEAKVSEMGKFGQAIRPSGPIVDITMC